MGLNAAPTAAAPRLIATAVTGLTPSRRVSSSSTGTSAMISSFMLSSTPPSANASEAAGITSAWEWPTRRTSHSTPWRSAPVSSTTVNAPPMRNTKKITAAASAMPRGIATRAFNGPTGRGGTGWYVPATTTVRPVVGSLRRSYSPAGSRWLASAAASTQPVSNVRGWGNRTEGLWGRAAEPVSPAATIAARWLSNLVERSTRAWRCHGVSRARRPSHPRCPDRDGAARPKCRRRSLAGAMPRALGRIANPALRSADRDARPWWNDRRRSRPQWCGRRGGLGAGQHRSARPHRDACRRGRGSPGTRARAADRDGGDDDQRVRTDGRPPRVLGREFCHLRAAALRLATRYPQRADRGAGRDRPHDPPGIQRTGVARRSGRGRARPHYQWTASHRAHG